MSQNQQIALNELKGWFKEETAHLIEPMKNKGASLLEVTRVRISDTVESNRKIRENSQREMEKKDPKTYRFSRNANKFAENLARIIEAIKIPEDVSYDSLNTFCNDLKILIATTEQLRREAYPYITPYFIFDRRRLDVTLKRLQDINSELSGFLTSKYVKAKTVEGTTDIVDKLVETIKKANETKNEIQKIQQIEKSLQMRLRETQQNFVQVQNKVELTELFKVEEKIKELRGNVKNELRYLQKPFFKLQSRVRSGKIAIPLDDVHKLDDYLNDPFEALATEEEGYPKLRSISKKLNEAIDQKKLKLKTTRLRKAQEQIDSMLNTESFSNLHKNCVEVRYQKSKMLTSAAIIELQARSKQLQNQLKELKKKNEFTTSRGKALNDEHKKLEEKIEVQKKELEGVAFEHTNKNIQVILT